MDSLLARYRNILVLIAVLLGQLLLLGYQIRTQRDVPLIRVWAVTAVTPFAMALEAGRAFFQRTIGDYFHSRDLAGENRRLREEVGRLKLENQYLRNELTTADRARALHIFQQRTPSKTVAARVIGTGPGPASRIVYLDVGTPAGVRKGMAVVAPDGIVGKIVAAYPTSSLVQLVTDPNFAAGVISQKSRAKGILRGLDGGNACRVDYIATEYKLEVGEWFFTSGEDRVFPKGLPAGRVKSVERGAQFQKVIVEPTGTLGGLEEVLVVVETVHGQIPENAEPLSEVYVAPPPPEEHPAAEGPTREGFTGTDADLLMEKYRAIGASQGLRFGETSARPPDFNAPIRAPAANSDPAGAPDGGDAAGAPPGEVPARSPQTAAAAAKPETSGPAPPTGSAAPLSPERRR